MRVHSTQTRPRIQARASAGKAAPAIAGRGPPKNPPTTLSGLSGLSGTTPASTLAAVTAMAAVAVLLVEPRPLQAAGLERIDVPLPSVATTEGRERNRQAIADAEASFQESDLLRSLKEKTELHRDGRKKELLDTYCRRQAELGVGDCAGLRLIPGATKSGVQEKPQWLKNLVGEE
jgi:hypothetical protein